MRASWTTAGLASRGRRLASAALAVVLGVAFLATSLALLVTAQRGMADAFGAGLREADLVVSRSDGTRLPAATYDRIAALDEVAAVRGETGVSGVLGPQEWVYGAPALPAGTTLLSGRLPVVEGEVLANRDLARTAGVGEGLTVQQPSEDGTPSGVEVALVVVGVADFADTVPALSFGPGFAAVDATLRSVDPLLAYDTVSVDLADGTDAEAARRALANVAGGALVQTGPEAAAERVAQLTGETDVLAAVLLGFGTVALATAAMVIANTFTITLAQRTGELALLRAVGATTGQVRRLVLVEAVALGVLASAAGVLLGLLGALGLLVAARRLDLGVPLDTGVAVTPAVVLLPLAAGVATTVLASLWPAVRATRVSPLAALRPAGGPPGGRGAGWFRLGTALALVVAGVAAMGYAATSRDELVGVAGGLLSFLGVLVAAVVVVPAGVQVLGSGARLAGVPGRLAVDNAVRNPGRAAATSAALLVGVTLITMTSVGAASAERTALGEIDSAYAVDLLVEGGSRPAGDGSSPAAGDDVVALPVDPATVARLQAVEGVASARAVDTAYLDLDAWAPALVLGLDPERDGDVVRSPALADLVPGTVGMGKGLLVVHGVEPGDTVTLAGPGGSEELRVVELATGYHLSVSATDLQRLGGDGVEPGAVLVRLADDADVAGATSAVRDVADDEELALSGAAVERAAVTQALDVLVLVTTALLAVAVVIAVVGIANTLSLSVVERRREHALLRGLGLTRTQMRSMLLVEGVLLAGVSTVLGVLLGLGYAALGVQTVLPAGTPLQLSVPWPEVAAIVGVAVLAGVLASVLPARRATRVSPAEGVVAA